MADLAPLARRPGGQPNDMNGTGEGKSPGFMMFAGVVVGVALTIYIVFICLEMARTTGARENLAALAAALGAGVLAGALGFVGAARKR
jgi:hypothetical protein